MTIKKLILATSLLTSTAFADSGDFYVRLKLSQLHPQKINNLTSKPVILPGIALGYNISDDMRFDISMSHISNISHRGTITESSSAKSLLPPAYSACDCPPIFIHNVKPVVLRSKLTTCKLNMFVDIYKEGKVSVYVGGGVGGTRIQRTMITDGVKENSKPYYTMSYDIHGGVNHKVREDITVGVGYTFKNLTENTYNYKGHSMATSVTIDF